MEESNEQDYLDCWRHRDRGCNRGLLRASLKFATRDEAPCIWAGFDVTPASYIMMEVKAISFMKRSD